MRELSIVVGGQYGSEGKGAVIGHLAQQLTERDLVVRVGGPNAGHTVLDSTGRTYRLRQIPAAAPVSPCQLHIAAGSEIDGEVLGDEYRLLVGDGHAIDDRLTIDPMATVLTYEHKNTEAELRLTRRIGSTAKGIGAARAARIMREAKTFNQAAFELDRPTWQRWTGARDYRSYRHVVVEGTQGYGLGLHTRHYPYTTSADCTAIDVLSQAQISPWMQPLDRMTVWLTCRVFPIRVAGNSGVLRNETTWEALGLPPEQTTVTGRTRRVGTWDPDLVRQAVHANGGSPVVKIALMMVDQMFPEIRGITDQADLELASGFSVIKFIEQIEQDCDARVGLVGTSPSTCVWMQED